MQRLVVQVIDVCFLRCFFSLCRRPVGFKLVAAVALPDFPRPVLCAFLRLFLGFMRSLHAGTILVTGLYLVVDENTRFLRGAG